MPAVLGMMGAAMRQTGRGPARIRRLAAADRPAVHEIVEAVGNFNAAEIACALELVDVYLGDASQRDYSFAVAEDEAARVRAYACWGPTPLARGTFDLYWIATHPAVQGMGYGHALIAHVEALLIDEKARILVAETSSKPSYEGTLRFYRALGYEETSRIRDFYDVGDDKVIFVKRFSRQGG